MAMIEGILRHPALFIACVVEEKLSSKLWWIGDVPWTGRKRGQAEELALAYVKVGW